MSGSGPFLSASEAAARLGVSAKALRLYEWRGLLTPGRSAAGWRVYGPETLARAGGIVRLRLRRLGLGLAEIARVLAGDADTLSEVLAGLDASLARRLGVVGAQRRRVHELRSALAAGQVPTVPEPEAALAAPAGPPVVLSLPWPWDGERFEIAGLGALAWLTGPLGSGKTRLARALAAALPGATFVPLGRGAVGRPADDPARDARVEQTLRTLCKDGASDSPALRALLAILEDEGRGALVIDLVEQGLDGPTREALAGQLRRCASLDRPLVVMTRSTAVLDLDATGPDEKILHCPANHSVPVRVLPVPGTPGYEALTLCLASPEVRARSEGVVALRPAAVPRA